MKGRKGSAAGGRISDRPPAIKEMSLGEKLQTAAVNLASQIKGTKRKTVAGGDLTGSVSLMADTTKEYLYLSSGHLHRAINETTNGIIRNGYTVIPENKSDQEGIDQLMNNTPFDTLMHSWILNAHIYGMSYIEPYDGENGVTAAEIPPTEMKFKTDASNDILYTKDGTLEGYEQERDGKVVAEWEATEIAALKFLSLGGSDVGISSLQAALHPATQAGLIRSTSAEAFSRSLNVVHVAIEDATAEDIIDVSDALSQDFTSESAYVTSNRYSLSSVGNASASINVAQYLEPNIAEIAAAYSMPIELISATATFRIDDFAPRYEEWLQSLKVKQKLVADVLEKQLFSTFCEEPVEIKFNDPSPINKTALLNNIGFATQSKVFTEAEAKKAIQDADIFGEEVFKGKKA